MTNNPMSDPGGKWWIGSAEEDPLFAEVPFVAVGAGEAPPWAHLPLTCPEGCTPDVLPLLDSNPPMLSFIKCPVCSGVWVRGPLRA